MFNKNSSLKNIPYKVKLSKRAKRMRIAVYSDSSVVLTLPLFTSQNDGAGFIEKKINWIFKSLKRFSSVKNKVGFRVKSKTSVKFYRKDYLLHKSQALDLATKKVYQWNNYYNLKYLNINVKNQKTRWGSCSKKGNLNFNYRIVHLPESLVDYLVVHELCHLAEFNHSHKFWDLVKVTMPNYKELRSRLRNFELLK